MRFPGGQGIFYVCQPRPIKGGQAEVFKAIDEEGNTYAIKMTLDENSELLLEEYEFVLKLLKNPELESHIVPFTDFGEYDDRFFVVMPWLENSLGDWIQNQTLSERLQALKLLSESVLKIQNRNIVHRDIKPSNAFIVEENGVKRVLLSDFGSAKEAHRSQADFLTGVHTYLFAPVDQVLPRKTSQLDSSWDVYALANTVFYCLTGSLPNSTIKAYSSLTQEGKQLKTEAEKYYRKPTKKGFEAIEALSRLPLEKLLITEYNNKLNEDDRTFLFTSIQKLFDGPDSDLRAELVVRALENELNRALINEPTKRSKTAEGLLKACDEALKTLHRKIPRRLKRKKQIVTGVGVVCGLILASYPFIPKTRDLLVEVEIPPWADAELFVDGKPSDLFIENISPGQHIFLIKGALYYDNQPDRCFFEKKVNYRYRPGIGRVHLKLEVEQDCPTAESGYNTVMVPEGTWQLGAKEGEWFREGDEESYQYNLQSPFLIMDREVSQGLWREVAEKHGLLADPVEEARVGSKDNPGEKCHYYQQKVDQKNDAYPVACITFCESILFANALSETEGLKPAYINPQECELSKIDENSNGWRLPTEAQWEIAARAGNKHSLLSGSYNEDIDRVVAEVHQYANMADPSFKAVFPQYSVLDTQNDGFVGFAPTGSLNANAWGIFDMSGNVREWVWDTTDGQRMFKGTSFDDSLTSLRLGNKGFGHSETRYNYVGLRLIKPAP